MNKITVSKNNEGTAFPFWAIIDPKQNFKTNEEGIHAIAGMITGIWFSRESAERHLKSRHYEFSENAKVFCFSGYWSGEYREALNEGGFK